MSDTTQADFDTRDFRRALGRFATGITVVTACSADGRPVGLTVNSFNSVSLEPPLVLWSLSHRSSSREIVQCASHFAVNVLSAEQKALSDHFARSGGDKFDGVDWQPGLDGAPLFPGCCAWFECRVSARHDGGDHTIVVGEVKKFAHDVTRAPLLYFGGEYRYISPTE